MQKRSAVKKLLQLEQIRQAASRVSAAGRKVAQKEAKGKDQAEADRIIGTVHNLLLTAFDKRERKIEFSLPWGSHHDDPPFLELSGPYELVRQWADKEGFRTAIRKKESLIDQEKDEYFLVIGMPKK